MDHHIAVSDTPDPVDRAPVDRMPLSAFADIPSAKRSVPKG